MNINVVDLLFIIICFQLVLFSVFLFAKKPGSLSNYILGIQIFSQAAGCFNSFCAIHLEYFFDNLHGLAFIGFPFTFLWGPTFFFYIKSVAYKDFKPQLKNIIHFVPFILFCLFLGFYIVFLNSTELKLLLINNSIWSIRIYSFIDLLVKIQVLFYIILSVITLHETKNSIKEKHSSISQMNFSWLQFLVIGFTISFVLTFPVASTLSNTVDNFRPWYPFSVIVPYFIYFNIIFFNAWLRPEIFKGVENKVKYKYSKLTEKETALYLKSLNEYMEMKKPFLDPNLSLTQLAEGIGLPLRLLSQVINENFRKNFYDYINGLRIEESKRMLLDKNNKKTILEILYTVGFNNKSVFNIAFKKFTGFTPSEFRKKYSGQNTE